MCLFCIILITWHDSQWLLHQRSQWVAENSTDPRNSLVAGRTGTRLNNGRPQTRWEERLVVAKAVLEGRSLAERGSNALSIGTIVREAVTAARALFANSVQSQRNAE